MRYFNVKVGSADVNGGIVGVDNSNTPPKLEDFLDKELSDYEIFLFGTWDKGFVYEVKIPKCNFPNYSTSKSGEFANFSDITLKVPDPRKKIEYDVLQLHVSGEGMLTLNRSRPGEAYIGEISEEDANRMKTEKERWDLEMTRNLPNFALL
ncbi:MAG: hypothetical protein AABX03_01410 [Nanoarchaeota archaeon]